MWRTEASWQGTCRVLKVTLTDGTVYSAHFKVKAKCGKNHDHSKDNDDEKDKQPELKLSVPEKATVGQAGLMAEATGGTVTAGLTYASTTPTVCTVNATTGAITTLAVGTCSISATRAATAHWLEVTDSKSFQVKASTTVTTPTLPPGSGYFEEPILPTRLNSVEGGSTVPVKIFVPGLPSTPNAILSITSVAESCANLPTGSDPDYNVLENIASAADMPAHMLNIAEKQGPAFSGSWVTSASWAGTCRVLNVTLTNGKVYSAHFSIKAKK